MVRSTEGVTTLQSVAQIALSPSATVPVSVVAVEMSVVIDVGLTLEIVVELVAAKTSKLIPACSTESLFPAPQ